MNDNWCIGIMTYSKRFHYLSNLIENIRSQNKDIIIFLGINGDYNTENPLDSIYNETYRKQILNLCLQYEGIYIRQYSMFRSCSYIFNDLVCNCGKENVIITNDDVVFKYNFIEEYKQFINNLDDKTKYLVRVNNSNSTHFVTRKFLVENNFYNEKFLGLGCEDCEFMQRAQLFTNNTIVSFQTDKHDNLAGYTISDLSSQGANTKGSACDKYHIYSYEVSYKESCEPGYVYINPRPTEKFFFDNYLKFWKNE